MDEPQGRARGGKARSDSQTPEERKALAKKAAAARWADDVPTATHIGELHIGDLALPCAVLPDGTRVISQGGVTTAFGPVSGGWQARQKVADEQTGGLPSFLVAKSLKPFIGADLATLVSEPKKYRDPRGGPIRIGLEAGLLPQVCEVWLKARDASALTKIQEPVAMRADVLMRGLAHTGIIALVDEATGYQRDRARDALAKILEAFIAKELQPWVKTFPPEFYEQMFRLRGLDFPTSSVKRPQYFGMLTNNIVYDRLAPGVLAELKRVTPRNDEGRPKAKYFQSLSQNTGYSRLKEHIGAVMALMRISTTWEGFMALLDKHYTRYGETIPLPMDDGRGL